MPERHAFLRPLMMALAALAIFAAVAVSAAPAATESVELRAFEIPFENLGLGGGGGMYTPAISSHDPRIMFMACDMSGLYRSVDGGLNWQIIPFQQINGARVLKTTFDPSDPDVMYNYGGAYAREQLRVSRDKGRSWSALVRPQPWGQDHVIAMAVDPSDGRVLFVGTVKGAYRSVDGGRSWTQLQGLAGSMKAFHLVAAGPGAGETVFAAAEGNIWRSDDRGETWESVTGGITGEKLTGFTGAEAPEGGTVLFCTMETMRAGDRLAGGIFRSTDLGETWASCMTPESGLNIRIGKIDEWGSGEIPQYYDIDMSARDASTVYVCAVGTGYWPPYHNTIYRSSDGGATWKAVFSSDARFIRPEVVAGHELNVEPGWLKYDLNWGNAPASGFTVSDGNPDYLLRVENGATYVSHDGGRSWKSSYTRLAPGASPGRKSRWVSTGMEVTTTWHYYWDPFDYDTQYICYTDIGFARSHDGGNSWTHSPDGSPWTNTFYDIAIDPERRGVIFAACSNVHDIPHSTYTDISGSRGVGGVALSTDGGRSWKPIWNGPAPQPITSIVLDPRSPADSRTLYVTSWREGIYKSTDGGRTWARKVNGFGTRTNQRGLMAVMVPSGTLYAGTGPIREGSEFPHPGGLYRSTDGAESWTCINAQLALGWQTGFAVDPTDENNIYVAAASGWRNRQGGLYRTTDGGRSWRQVFSNATPGSADDSVQAMFVTLHPDDPATVYLGTDGHGLWLSRDAGATWKLFEGIPFATIHRVHFDPRDHSRIVVTTFGGGVWRGPAMGAPVR